MAAKPTCVVCKRRPQAKGRRGKCSGCYQQDYRAGQKTVADDLGDDPARFHFKGPRTLERRFHAAVPKDKRSRVLREALGAWLDRTEEASPSNRSA